MVSFVVLDPETIAFLTAIMQTSAAMYAIAFIVFEIRRSALTAKTAAQQAADGFRSFHTFHRIAYWGANVVATIFACTFAILYRSPDLAALGIGLFLISLGGLGFLIVAEPGSMALESTAAPAAKLLAAELLEYIKAHPDEALALAGKSADELVDFTLGKPEIMNSFMRKLRREFMPWYVRRFRVSRPPR